MMKRERPEPVLRGRIIGRHDILLARWGPGHWVRTLTLVVLAAAASAACPGPKCSGSETEGSDGQCHASCNSSADCSRSQVCAGGLCVAASSSSSSGGSSGSSSASSSTTAASGTAPVLQFTEPIPAVVARDVPYTVAVRVVSGPDAAMVHLELGNSPRARARVAGESAGTITLDLDGRVVNHVATFSVSIPRPGQDYSLVASADGFPSVRSRPFAVVGGWYPADGNPAGVARAVLETADRALVLGTSRGLYRSPNRGADWFHVLEDVSIYGMEENDAWLWAWGNVGGRASLWRSTDDGVTWEDQRFPPSLAVLDVKFYPGSTSVALAAALDKAFLTTDRGLSWTEVRDSSEPGSDGFYAFGAYWDAANPGTAFLLQDGILYADAPTGGILRSTLGGLAASWVPFNEGLEPVDTSAWTLLIPRAMARSPSSGLVFVNSGVQGSAAAWRMMPGSTSWSIFNDGLPSPVPELFGLVPLPGQPDTLFASSAAGFYESIGGGAWQPVGRGLEGLSSAGPLRSSPHTPGLWLVPVESSAALSTDSGETWTRAPGTAVDFPDIPLAIDRLNPDRFYAGLNATDDGGRTWRRMRPPLGDVPAGGTGPASFVTLAADSEHMDSVYVAARFGIFVGAQQEQHGLLFRSSDAGRTWEQVEMPWLSAGPSSFFRQLHVRSDLVLGMTEGGRFYASTDGVTFSDANTGLSNVGRSGFRWAGGTVFYTAGGSEKIARTNDGGLTWTPAAGDLAFAPEQLFGGLGWHPLLALRHVDVGGGVRRAQLWRTYDLSTWSLASEPPLSSFEHFEFTDDSAFHLLAKGTPASPDGATFLQSLDLGNSWQPFGAELGYVSHFWPSGQSNVVYATCGRGLVKTVTTGP